MKIIRNATGLPVGAGVTVAQIPGNAMKTIIKRTVMQLYCRELIKGSTVIRAFNRFALWGA